MIELLATDAAWVAVDKPAGVAVVPARREPADDCLRSRLERQLGAPLWVVHRLDRDTSGAVLFARTAEAHRTLSLAFEQRRIGKRYLAFVAGAPLAERGVIETALHAARRGKSRPAAPGEPGAREARTRFRVLDRWRLAGGAQVAALEVEPESGRHHQIRVHLRSAGAPILFDPLYGAGAERSLPAGAPAGRLALHAARLLLPAAPPGAEPRVVESPLATDLAALAAWLAAELPAV